MSNIIIYRTNIILHILLIKRTYTINLICQDISYNKYKNPDRSLAVAQLTARINKPISLSLSLARSLARCRAAPWVSEREKGRKSVQWKTSCGTNPHPFRSPLAYTWRWTTRRMTIRWPGRRIKIATFRLCIAISPLVGHVEEK